MMNKNHTCFPPIAYRLLWALPLWFCLNGFFGCQNGNVILDNAAGTSIALTVDDEKYFVEAGGRQKIQLDPGVHLLKIRGKDAEALEEVSFTVDEGGVLNLALSDYYIWTDLYGDPKLKALHLNQTDFVIDKKKYYGQFVRLKSDDRYIEKIWDYNLDENFPSDIIGYEFTEEKYIIKSKIFREKELIEAYNALVK